MKLRLYGDSLRLRLSRSEVDRIGCGTAIEAVTHFSSHYLLECRLELSVTDRISVDFIPMTTGVLLLVALPKSDAMAWAKNTVEGMYGEQVNEGTGRGVLAIAVEKDFECLHTDNAAENHDAFPNPRERP